MNAIRILFFIAVVMAASAEEIAVTVLASIDSNRIAAASLKKEVKNDMPDFTITYLHGPETMDVIGIYEGGHPSPFSARGKRLGEVKDIIAGQPIVWACWSQEIKGVTQYGAETFLPSRKTVATLNDGKKQEFIEQFHVFIMRRDLQALAAARKLATSIIKKGPNQMPVPVPGGVAHR